MTILRQLGDAILEEAASAQQDTRAYVPLTVDTVPAYLTALPAVMEILGGSTHLDCVEIGDGNLNLVFIVRAQDDPAKSVIIKQALPYLRCAGDGWPLSRERMEYEHMALALEAEIVPELVPAVYHYDRAMSLIVMENLDRHVIMRKGLVEGITYPRFPGHMGHFLAHTLFHTSDLYLASARKKRLVGLFSRNVELCKITEDFVFTNPYMESAENRWNPEIDDVVQRIRAHTRLKCEIAALKDGFLTRTQSLVHGDLHTGSVMLNQEDTRIIDPEFAFFGPMGFDIGAVLGNLALAYCAHEVHSTTDDARAAYQGWLLETIRETWDTFAGEFLRLWREKNEGEATRPAFFAQCGGEDGLDIYRRQYLTGVLRDTLGYAGCKMMRRQLGIAHVYDIDCIADPKRRAVAERLALAIGARFVLERQYVQSIDEMLAIIKTTKEL